MGSKQEDKMKQQHNAQIPQVDVEKKIHKKRKKRETDTIGIRIQTIHANSDKMSPLVGYFSNGFDPCSDSSSINQTPPLVNVYNARNRNNMIQVVVSPNGTDHVNFVGTNYSGEAAAPQLCTYALGVLDKETQTLKIVPITANKIFRLEPKLAESEATQDEARENPKFEVNNEEKIQKLRRLDSMYSTKKIITKNKKIDSLNQKHDLRSKQELEEALEEVKVNPKALNAGTTDAHNIPFHDMFASTPEKAYPLEKIIEKGEWEYLSDLLNISQGAEVISDDYPIYVRNRVDKLTNIKDEYEKSKVASILQYITHLINYKDKHSGDQSKSVKNHKFPSILEAKFRNMFDEAGSRRNWNFLISHVLVLSLFVDGYRSDPSDIAKDLKLNGLELRKHYKGLGCKLVWEESTLYATLPVPLTFPGTRAVHRQMKRNK